MFFRASFVLVTLSFVFLSLVSCNKEPEGALYVVEKAFALLYDEPEILEVDSKDIGSTVQLTKDSLIVHGKSYEFDPSSEYLSYDAFYDLHIGMNYAGIDPQKVGIKKGDPIERRFFKENNTEFAGAAYFYGDYMLLELNYEFIPKKTILDSYFYLCRHQPR